MALVETVNPRKKEVPKGYLKAVVGATKRQVETKRVEEEAAAGSVEDDLVNVLKVRCNHTPNPCIVSDTDIGLIRIEYEDLSLTS